MNNAYELLEREKLTIGLNEPTSPEDQLEHYKKLTAILIHEINNPLTTIKGFLQLIKPDLNSIGKEEYANIALEEIERVNKLIVDFFDVVKPFDRQRVLVSINHMIEDLVKQYQFEAIKKNITMNTHLTREDIHVLVIEKKLRQVFINLIKNAIEAIDEGNKEVGVIDIYTEIKNSYVFIHIKDNGKGMSAENAEQLFTPFFTTKLMGTGIGLTICKEIIEFHKGTIEFSTAINQGTKFTIKLPL
jgi:signal transduction histidine kinase